MDSFVLDIKEPCAVDWETMQPAEQGRFCPACQKTVVDFATMEEAEIIQFFQNYQGGALCKRVKKSQLGRSYPIKKANTKLKISRGRPIWRTAAVLVGLLLNVANAQGQKMPTIPTKQSSTDPNQPQIEPETPKYYRFKAQLNYKLHGKTELLPNHRITIQTHDGSLVKEIQADANAVVETLLPAELWESGFVVVWTHINMLGRQPIYINQRAKNLKIIFSRDEEEEIIWGD